MNPQKILKKRIKTNNWRQICTRNPENAMNIIKKEENYTDKIIRLQICQ